MRKLPFGGGRYGKEEKGQGQVWGEQIFFIVDLLFLAWLGVRGGRDVRGRTRFYQPWLFIFTRLSYLRDGDCRRIPAFGEIERAERLAKTYQTSMALLSIVSRRRLSIAYGR